MSVNADDNARHARQALILSVALRLALAQAICLTGLLRLTGRTRLPTQHVAPASPATEIAGIKAGIKTGCHSQHPIESTGSSRTRKCHRSQIYLEHGEQQTQIQDNDCRQ